MIRVLIADDSPVARRLIKTILKHDKRFEVVGEAKNGQEAIDLAKELSPDIITMDIVMPVKQGLESAEEILKFLKDVKIFLISSMIDKDIEKKAKEIGLKGVIQKPFSSSDFIEELVNSVKE